MKIRSYKREFVERVKMKFNDIKSSNNGTKSNTGNACDDKKHKECNAKRVAIRR
jgi:hypothetical protein